MENQWAIRRISAVLVMWTALIAGCESDRFVIQTGDVHDAHCAWIRLAIDNSSFRADTTGKRGKMDLETVTALVHKRENLRMALGSPSPVYLRYYKREAAVDRELGGDEFPFNWIVDPQHVQTEGVFLVTVEEGDKAKIEFHCAPCTAVDTAGDSQPSSKPNLETSFQFPDAARQQTEDWSFVVQSKPGTKLTAGEQFLVQVNSANVFAEVAKKRLEVSFVEDMFEIRYHDGLQSRASGLLDLLARAVVVDDLMQLMRSHTAALDAITAQMDSIAAAHDQSHPELNSEAANHPSTMAAVDAMQTEVQAKSKSELEAALAAMRAKSLETTMQVMGITDPNYVHLLEEKTALQIEMATLVPRLRMSHPASFCK